MRLDENFQNFLRPPLLLAPRFFFGRSLKTHLPPSKNFNLGLSLPSTLPTFSHPLLCPEIPIHISSKMAEEVYDGAIGIDLGMSHYSSDRRCLWHGLNNDDLAVQSSR